ncbi:MAG: Gamma-glutamyltranspeptidase [Thiothrix nivea]|nr:MAG: Gamma-glutamyltranspeptidase [Thiothrix nivea]
MIAAGHPLTAEAAQHILEAGGNAIDAMIAALFTASVVEPVLSSLGGGGFSLIQPASGPACLLDFFTQTPKQKCPENEADFYAATVDFGSTTQDFHIGNAAIATPGLISGLFAMHRQYGSLPMSLLTDFAAQQAKAFEVCHYQGYIFGLVAPIFLASAASRELYASQTAVQQIIQPGEIVHNPALADVLETLGREGEQLFYQGEIASAIVQQCQHGGHLSHDDLAAYRTELRKPLRFDYSGWSALINPPPSAGGTLITFALQLLQAVDDQLGDFAGVEHLRALREAMTLSSEARIAHTLANGQPEFDKLLDPVLIQRYRTEILNRSRAYRGTTHISIMDAQGNAVASTVSNGEGCGNIVPGTGIMLNNMLGEEDLNPTGFFRWYEDERMSSMMAPCIARHTNGDLIALGSGGSNRIRSAIMQVLVNLLHYELPVDVAVQAARLHVENSTTYLEGGFAQDVLQSLMADGREYRCWDEPNMFFGGVHTVARLDGQFAGAGDVRRGGVSVVV